MSDEKGITIVGIEINNFRRLKLARVKIDKKVGLVRITGKNRQGKTSLLDGIEAALGGTRRIGSNTIHEGASDEDRSFTRLLLSNGFTVERRFSPHTPKGSLTVLGSDGGKHGQQKIDEWLGERTFDPLALYDMDARKLAGLFLSLGKDPELGAKLADVRERRQEAYEERTQFIREERAAKTVEEPAGVRPDPVNLTEDLQFLEQFEAEQAVRAEAQRLRGRVAEEISAARARVEELRRQLEEAEADLDAATMRGEQLAAEPLPPDRTEEIAAVKAHIAEADAITRELEPWQEWDRAQDRLRAAQEEQRRLNAVLEACDAEVATLLQNAAIPVTGLTFDAEGLPMLNGRSWEVASGAERIQAAVETALAAKPKLRVCLLDEANDLDLDALVALDTLAKEHGFQVWAVRIGIEGDGEIVVEDGTALSAEAS